MTSFPECRPQPEYLYDFVFMSSSKTETSSPQTVGKLLQYLTGVVDPKVVSTISEIGIKISFPSSCRSWTDATSSEELSERVKNTVLSCYRLNRKVSQFVGSTLCIASNIMRTQASPLMSKAKVVQVCNGSREDKNTEKLVSLFDWSWKYDHGLNEETKSSRDECTSCANQSQNTLKPPTFVFIFENLKNAMEGLSDLYQEVYEAWKDNSNCSGKCMEKFKLDIEESSSEPMSCHSSQYKNSNNGVISSGGSCPFQEEVTGSILSYIESAMRDVIGKLNIIGADFE